MTKPRPGDSFETGENGCWGKGLWLVVSPTEPFEIEECVLLVGGKVKKAFLFEGKWLERGSGKPVDFLAIHRNS